MNVPKGGAKSPGRRDASSRRPVFVSVHSRNAEIEPCSARGLRRTPQRGRIAPPAPAPPVAAFSIPSHRARRVGRGVGVGVRVGRTVGPGVGVRVGLTVGAGVGVRVGLTVGADVGVRVGAGVAVGAGVDVARGVGVGVGAAGGAPSPPGPLWQL